MPDSFLSRLGRSASLVYPFVQRGIREGLSIENIGKAIRSGGYSIANETLRTLARRERDLQLRSSRIRFTPRNLRPDPRNFPEALTPILRQYSYIVEVRGRLTSSGERSIQNISVSSDRLLTPAQAESIAEDAVRGRRSKYGLDIERVVLVGALKAGTAGSL